MWERLVVKSPCIVWLLGTLGNRSIPLACKLKQMPKIRAVKCPTSGAEFQIKSSQNPPLIP